MDVLARPWFTYIECQERQKASRQRSTCMGSYQPSNTYKQETQAQLAWLRAPTLAWKKMSTLGMSTLD